MMMTLPILLIMFYGSPLSARQMPVEGKASYYADHFVGKRTASGVPYDRNKMTAAHQTLPFGTKVRVTNLSNGREVIVTINDRGPFVKGRIIDVSRAAAQKLDFIKQGITDVSIAVVETGDM